MAVAVAKNLLSVLDGRPRMEHVVNPEALAKLEPTGLLS
jgi:hypothetical protein